MGKPKLTSEQRFYIEKRLGEDISKRKIARELNVSPSTISRETNNNTLDDFKGIYCWRIADNIAKERCAQAKSEHTFSPSVA
ncbi:helix-turn-helix domain-containing protein [Vibrio pectenicida]|uniref:Hin recombinase n=1 Tax=Vibrio pectenicida TaxID=62763 RepID=A0A427TWN6_9VIBR|nr:helix-turn-helix domain-containing protein [Vibrio pectenicida]RSD28575.1 Hin recombinase [Vibrio pectenicida]